MGKESDLKATNQADEKTPEALNFVDLFSKEELRFILQCVAESTIKAKDASSVANVLYKLKQVCDNGVDSK